MLHSCGTETQVKDSRPGKDGILIRRRRMESGDWPVSNVVSEKLEYNILN